MEGTWTGKRASLTAGVSSVSSSKLRQEQKLAIAEAMHAKHVMFLSNRSQVQRAESV